MAISRPYNEESPNKINMGASMKWLQHFVVIFVAIKTALYMKVYLRNLLRQNFTLNETCPFRDIGDREPTFM